MQPASARAKCLDAIVDSMVREQMVRRHVVGASLAVFQRGHFLKRTAYGHANLETGEMATPETQFFIASITKAFTAAAVAALVEDRKLVFDAPISPIIPGLPQAWKLITVRHLLASTAGLPAPRMRPGTAPATYAQLLDSLLGKPLVSPPGAVWDYEQPAYEILNDIIERVAGMGFDRFVEDRLLRPARVSATFGDYRLIRPGIAQWYSRTGVSDGWKFVDTVQYVLRTEYPRYRWPSAGMHITAGDLARWISAFGRGAIVRMELVDSVWAPTVLADGRRFTRTFGAWFSDSTANGQVFTTSGGARATVKYWRDLDLAVVVLTNFQGAPTNHLASSIGNLYSGPQVGPGAQCMTFSAAPSS